MAEYIDREALIATIVNTPFIVNCSGESEGYKDGMLDGLVKKQHHVIDLIQNQPPADVVEVVSGYNEGDICVYQFDNDDKSLAIVEIVKVLNDERGIAEIKFIKVIVDDTGNGMFNYLFRTGKTMNASFKYLKNIMPCSYRERKGGEKK